MRKFYILSLLKLKFQSVYATEIHKKNTEVLVIIKGKAFRIYQTCKTFTVPPANGKCRLASKPDVHLLQWFNSTASLL
jgi:hypothetical protein